MKTKLVNEQLQVYVLVLDSGDEVIECLTRFAKESGISSAQITGIGAFSGATVGYFDFNIKDYRKIPIEEQVELLSLLGDISLYDNEPKVHAHVVLGKADGAAYGGHLLKANVKPTLEITLTVLPTQLQRAMDSESGIPLIRL